MDIIEVNCANPPDPSFPSLLREIAMVLRSVLNAEAEESAAPDGGVGENGDVVARRSFDEVGAMVKRCEEVDASFELEWRNGRPSDAKPRRRACPRKRARSRSNGIEHHGAH